MSVPTGPVSALPPAGLDRRFYAFAIDRLIAWPILVGAVYLAYRLSSADGATWPGVLLVVGVVVALWLASSVLLGIFGTSPGKAATGLRVVRVEGGTPIGLGPALLRTLVLGVATLPTFGFGVAMLAQTAVLDRGRQRRGWHDHLTHGVVVDVRPPAEIGVAASDEAPRQVVNLTAMRLTPSPAPAPTPTPPRRQPATPGVPAAPSGPPPAPPTEPLATTPRPDIASSAESERTVVRGRPQEAASPPWRVTFDTGETFLVEGLGLVGRRPEGRPGEPVRHLVPLVSEDLSVSKTHAQFQIARDGVLVVLDRGSTNGSVLVRSGVARDLPPGKPTTLLSGDVVHFGDRSMTVVRES